MTRSSSNSRLSKPILIFIPLLIIVLDQIVKFVIRTGFDVGESLPVVEDVFHITYVRNRGAAFSLFADHPEVMLIVPGIAMLICLICLIYCLVKRYRAMSVALVMIIGGGISNMIDRFTLGYVVDMFDFRVFPVFNVADIAVTLGCAVMIVWLIFFEKGEEPEEPDSFEY
jgi:signal peptidase II